MDLDISLLKETSELPAAPCSYAYVTFSATKHISVVVKIRVPVWVP